MAAAAKAYRVLRSMGLGGGGARGGTGRASRGEEGLEAYEYTISRCTGRAHANSRHTHTHTPTRPHSWPGGTEKLNSQRHHWSASVTRPPRRLVEVYLLVCMYVRVVLCKGLRKPGTWLVTKPYPASLRACLLACQPVSPYATEMLRNCHGIATYGIAPFMTTRPTPWLCVFFFSLRIELSDRQVATSRPPSTALVPRDVGVVVGVAGGGRWSFLLLLGPWSPCIR